MKKFLLFALPFFLAHTAEAACAGPDQYQLLVPIGTLPGCVDLGTYVTGMFVTIIGIAGILAVVMIVICGIKLMASGSAGGKTEAKSCITNALFGVLLAVGSWLLLNTINPLLLLAKPTIGIPVSALPVTPLVLKASGILSWEAGPSCPVKAGFLVSMAPPTLCITPAPPLSVCCQYVAVTLPAPIATPPLPPIAPVIGPFVSVATNGPVWVDGTSISVPEGGVAAVTVRRAGNINGTVDYTAVSGSATAGADYVVTTGTLFFPAGTYQLTVNIPTLSDVLVEGNEKFTLTLSNPTGGLFLGGKVNQPVIIVDDDIDTIPPVVSILFPVSAPGLVTISPSISTKVNVTEETKLVSTDLYVVRTSTSVRVFSVVGCTTPACPIFGGTFDLLAKIGPYINETFDLVAKGCDAAGNCGWATTSIGLTKECNNVTNPTTTYRCFTLPSGVGATSSPTVVGRTNSHLVKLTTPLGGGTVSLTTIAPVWAPPPTSSPPAWCSFMSPSCAYGCDISSPWLCAAPVPPDPCTAKGLICAAGCDYLALPPVCFVPKPVVIASLAPLPGDISFSAPCGNGGSFPGSTILSIKFGAVAAAGTCLLKPNFNYYLNVTASDGMPHNFQINYNWVP